MATTTSSSDDSSTVPRDFHLPSSVDSGSRVYFYRQKCSLCNTRRKVFYCKDCVLSGSFYHSGQTLTESYAEKRKHLLQLEDAKKVLEKKCVKLMEPRLKADILRSKIRQYKEKTRIIKLAVEEKKQKRQKYVAELQRLRDHVATTEQKLVHYDRKVSSWEDVVEKRREGLKRLQESLSKRREELSALVKVRVSQLKYIFPIRRIEPKHVLLDSDTLGAISDGSQTTSNKDRWIMTDNADEEQFSIVEPTLPGSGNYSMYTMWVSQHKDVPADPKSELVDHNPAYNVSAALFYTAQLVHVLAFILGVRLPYRMLISDYCGQSMGEAQFNRRVARLNTNVLYLCHSQNIDLSTLKSGETIHNLLKLMDVTNPDMGRQGPFDIEYSIRASVEQRLNDDLQYSGEDSDSDGDHFHREWETVPRLQPDLSAMAPSLTQSQLINAQQQATSMAGGLVTSAAASIASMWRGITGR